MSHPFLNDKTGRIVRLLIEGGASDCLFVGGCVRDHLLGLDSKDYDIEVYGLGYDRIIRLLRPHFRVGLVGRSFATVKIDNEIDINIPRRESKSGRGHKGFRIEPDPSMSPEEATARRDFTINAIGMRVDGTWFDPFDGRGDLQRGILRATSEAFCDDPLRVLRGMQFAARFGFEMEPRTVELSKKVRDEFETLSAERVWGEWEKWAVKGRFPSKGLHVLLQTGWIECFPELAALPGVPQNLTWHPEGDVFVHTGFTVDAAAQIAEAENFEDQDRLILLFAALCHDFGKAVTTIQNEQGHWKSPRHAIEGISLAEAFLNRMKAPHIVFKHVEPLIREHMAHRAVPPEETPGDSIIRRLADRLVPSNIRMWGALARADAHGFLERERPILERWETVAEKLQVREARPQPLLQGRDLISLGIAPGKGMGAILEEAYQRQLDGEFTDREGALRWADDNTAEQ